MTRQNCDVIIVSFLRYKRTIKYELITNILGDAGFQLFVDIYIDHAGYCRLLEIAVDVFVN